MGNVALWGCHSKEYTIMRYTYCSFLLLLTLLSLNAQSQNERFEYRRIAVYFDFGSDQLDEASRSQLMHFAAQVEAVEGLRIQLVAHTDSIGRLEDNLDLSRRRAASVAAVLQAAGISDSLITTAGKGELDPVASNNNEQGRQQNRRVEIIAQSTIPMRELSGQIEDKSKGEGVPATVLLSTPTWSDSLQTDTAGRFHTTVPALEKVRIDAFAKGYFFDTKIVPPDESRSKAAIKLPLPRAEKGVSLPVKRLHFLGDQAILVAKSIPELDRLMRFLQVNDGMHISIHGHVNVPNSPPVRENSTHFWLSVRRAEHIYEFLVNSGVDPERLSYEGHGNSMMLYPNAVSEGQQAANRRVEIRVE
jgi:outer membrane protein OmpA-like peptidoglycan-associated protein